MSSPRVALVHDYLVMTGGAERLFLSIARAFPDAPVFTAVYRPQTAMAEFRRHDVRPLWPTRLPVTSRTYRAGFLAYAAAFSALRLDGYDVVLTSTSAFAKNAGADAGRRVCMCHTPPRFIWPCGISSEHAPFLEKAVGRALRPWLRGLDLAAAARVDRFAANSQQVRDRIRRFYDREAEVIHPPVDTNFFAPVGERGADYLAVGRLVAYKRFDDAVNACTTTGRRLRVAGEGRDQARLRALAGPSVSFLGFVAEAEMPRLYSASRAVIVPGEEDWGMTPVEANACGCPVIAAARGGNLESVVDGKTGVLYDPQVPGALEAAIERFESMDFDPAALREHALGFREEIFQARIRRLVESA